MKVNSECGMRKPELAVGLQDVACICLDGKLYLQGTRPAYHWIRTTHSAVPIRGPGAWYLPWTWFGTTTFEQRITSTVEVIPAATFVEQIEPLPDNPWELVTRLADQVDYLRAEKSRLQLELWRELLRVRK